MNRRISLGAIFIIALVALAVLLNSGTATASTNQTVFVDRGNRVSDEAGCGSKANPCNTVQAAVDRAQSGDTLSLTAGRYGNATIAKSLGFIVPEGNVTISSLTLESKARILGDPPAIAREVRVHAGAIIQEAILIARPWGEVSVCTGTYYETLLIDKSLSLVGNKCGDTPAIIDAGGSPSAFIITGRTTDVTVEKFRIRNAAKILIWAGSEDPSSPYGTSPNSVKIIGNVLETRFPRQNALGIQLGRGVTGNVFGNFILQSLTPGLTLSPRSQWAEAGILLIGTHDVLVAGNTVLFNKVGIGIVGFQGFLPTPAQSNDVVRNLVATNDCGICLQGEVLYTDIEHNKVRNNGVGLRLLALQFDGATSNTHVQFNEFDDNGQAVVNSMSGGEAVPKSLRARQNWWGSKKGPLHEELNPAGEGNEVGDNVTFSPWCATKECTSFHGTPARLVFLRHPGGAQAGKAFSVQPVVHVLDAEGELAFNFTGMITLRIGANPEDRTFHAVVTAEAVEGTAVFPSLSIGTPGKNYTLVASSPGMKDTVSNRFNVLDSGVVIVGLQPATETSAVDLVSEAARGFTGTIPPKGGVSFLSTSTSITTEDLVRSLNEQGCAVELLAILKIRDGSWDRYIPGALQTVNAGFPSQLSTGITFFVRCR